MLSSMLKEHQAKQQVRREELGNIVYVQTL